MMNLTVNLMSMMIAGARRRAETGAVAVLCVVAIACGSDNAPPVKSVAFRVIDASAQETFAIEDIAVDSEVVDLSPDPASTDGGWRLTGEARRNGWREGRLVARMTAEGAFALTREMEAPSSEIDIIEIEIGGLRPTNFIRLLWADSDEGFKKRRSIRMGARQGVGTGVRTFRFDVGNHLAWLPDVSRIRIEVSGAKVQVRLGRVVATRLTLDDDRFSTALAQPWLVDLGGVHRAAMLAVPETAIEHRFAVPPGAELRFGLGVPETQSAVVRFRVVLADAAGNGGEEVVFDRDVENEARDGWLDYGVDLSDHAGRDVRLRFEVETDPGLDPLLGPPMWADPVVWAPTVDETPPNVVLISLDTLRADHMSLYGYYRRTTPNIDRWAKRRAVVFETAVASSHWTLPSHVSLLTGIEALGHGVNHAVPAPPSLLTIAERLHSRGYTTGAVSGGSYLHPRFGLAQGIEEYRSYKGELTLELETELEQALAWIEEQRGRGPWFLFFHTYEVHDPYEPREPFFSEYAGKPFDSRYKEAATRAAGGDHPKSLQGAARFTLRRADGGPDEDLAVSDAGVVVDLYDSGLAYTDAAIQRLFDRLSEPDLRDNTLVIVTSDHGEALGEHRLAGHNSLYDHNLLVPLVVELPGGRFGGRRVESQVRLVDVAATILDVAGLDPSSGMDGRSLVPLVDGSEEGEREAQSYSSLSNHGLALRSDSKKYIFRNIPWRLSNGWEELYDLASDPREEHNLAASSESTTGYRHSAVETLSTGQSGMRLVMTNTSDRVVSVEVGATGMVIGPTSIKTTQPEGRCSLLGTGRLGCEIHPGVERTLIFERVQDSGVEIDGRFFADGTSWERTFSLRYEIGGDDGPREIAFGVDGAAVSEPRGREGTVSLVVFWVGDATVLGLDPADSDAELRQQLQALGYIE